MVDVLDRGLVACFRTQIVEQLGDTLLTIGIFPEWIDDPDLSQVYCGGEGSRFGVVRDEFDILDTATLCQKH